MFQCFELYSSYLTVIIISSNVIHLNPRFTFLVDNPAWYESIPVNSRRARCVPAPCPTIISGFASFQEFGSLRHSAAHTSSCIRIHMTAAPAATLMVPSIKKPSKCAIYSFSFSYLFLLYMLPGEGSQEPGQLFSQISYLLFRRFHGTPGAPPVHKS